ncbi:D-glycero-beta-D-manno-heptose 1-phosphate adenylyltransferase [Candidatus Dependentiae bacterium]|nr:D-glycero-beta-D-manno-heptose 1-phosphate adenylyltransferase [Candidatus Dependentiae bacterium]
MKNLINKIRESVLKNIIVIGDIMLDEYIFGSVSRISPEAPVLVLKEEKKEWSLGGAANVALNCKKIGSDINLVGVINNSDFSSKKILSILAQNEIAVSNLIRSENRVTTCKKRALSNNHQLLRIDTEDNKNLDEKEFILLLEKISKLIKPDSIILISDYAKGIVSQDLLNKIINLADKNNCKVLVDPKGNDFLKYKNVNYIKPNYKEYNLMLEFFGLQKNDSIIKNGKIICEKLFLDGLIVTLGDKGIQFVSQDKDFFIPALKKEVYDLTGAGDTVFAFLALGLSADLSIKESLKLANHAAGIAVSHLKTYAVGLQDLLDDNIFSLNKIFHDWANLKAQLDWLRSESKKIVFTNGCFDLLHSGHLHVLNEAKALGDILVVAINTDESVKRYKGNARPIKSLQERINIMSALSVVDYVVPFSQDTPRELIEYLKPDVLVKGGDYKKENIAGADFVLKSGGFVKVVDYQKNLSTTNLVNSLKMKMENV